MNTVACCLRPTAMQPTLCAFVGLLGRPSVRGCINVCCGATGRDGAGRGCWFLLIESLRGFLWDVRQAAKPRL